MNKRERISIFVNNSSRSYLLCRIINIGDSINPDLKFTDVSSYGYITSNGRYDGGLTPDVKIDFATNQIELSYHRDGSPLYKSPIKGGDKPWRSNYMQQGFRQNIITECTTILPLIIFQIRNPKIYKNHLIESGTNKKKVFICYNDILFNDEQSLFAVIYVRNKIIPLSKVTTKDYYSDILAELTEKLDLCVFICRHSYPLPKPYYDNGLKGWITPYPCNTVSFCDQQALFDELVLKLHNNIFDRVFAYFMDIIGDGKLVHLDEEKLLILDEIDIFFEKLESPVIHKPEFARFVFEVFKGNLKDFNSQTSLSKQRSLEVIWRAILKEGKQRNWF